VYVIVFSLN